SDEVLINVVQTLERILDVSHEKLMALLSGTKKSSVVVKIADEISRKAMFSILEQRPNLPGVTITSEPMRHYPYHAWGSHMLGHLGEISQQELSTRSVDGYKQGDIIGKSGIESVYDYYLKGKPGGMQLEVDATGRSQRILYDIPSIPGNNVVLNIDRYIQDAAETMFRKSNFAGAAVAIDPWSGKVLALVSSPNYDPNLFLKPLDPETKQELFFSEENFMFNRALSGQYALGSVFKIIPVIAGMETGSPLIHETVRCKGKFKLGRQEFKCWKKHGVVDLLEAVTHSCNVYFYQLGLSATLTPLVKYSRLFGLGEENGIDLPGEKSGLMPDAGWKKKNMKEIWYDGDTVNLSIGQGFLLVTPLQAACLAAAVASRGKLYRAYLLDKITNPNGDVMVSGKHHLIRHIHLSTECWDMLDRSLVNVVEAGTGRACRIPGLIIAGKTGTVQNPHGLDHAWFVAYASLPDEKPRIACAVLVEHGEHGSTAAAPIAREMIRAAFPEIEHVR
ncbi:MAG: penicillin-binding protein 2, partial [Elusimicrobia bacterium]|nr:penicillin-binding protein 2 [Elusimicrobiota bacterium]